MVIKEHQAHHRLSFISKKLEKALHYFCLFFIFLQVKCGAVNC